MRRELREALGLAQCEPGRGSGCHHPSDWKSRRSQREEYRIVPIQRFDARMLNANEARFVTELKRWKVADLARAAERLTPLAAADIVQGYLASGAPDPLPPEEVPID